MELTQHVRKPFFVEATKITNENIHEIAKFVGTLKENPDGTPYIQVNRKKVPNVYRVEPGFWMTRMGKQIRCYVGHIFEEQFIEVTPKIKELVDDLNGDTLEEASA